MNLIKKALFGVGFLILAHSHVNANQERSGQAGADQLLINPWSSSSGVSGINMANVTGFEAMSTNPAGLVGGSMTTEVGYARTSWLSGSEIFINSLGFTQKLGMDNENAFGISLTSLDLGQIERTTINNPEGEFGNYTPQYFNLGIGYSRLFSHAIRGGAVIRTISESIPEVGAIGVAIDAGIQYIAGEYDHIRFGIALRNIGPPMVMRGEGLTVRGSFADADFDMSLQQRSQSFELPALLSIAASYGMQLQRGETENMDGELVEKTLQELTFSGVFISNSFSNDHLGLSAEYNFRDRIMLRAGYLYEEDILDADSRVSAFTGPTAGASLRFGLGSDLGAFFQVDYAFRHTQHFNHTHNFGGRIIF
jgi:hypothetical protein